MKLIMKSSSLALFVLILSSCSQVGVRSISNDFNCRLATSQFLRTSHLNQKNRLLGSPQFEGIRIVEGDDLILVDEGLRHEVEKQRRVYKRLLNLRPGKLSEEEIQKRVSRQNTVLKDWKKKLGKGVTNSTFRDASTLNDIVILTRATNHGAYSFIGHKAILKPSFIKAKTAKYGLIKGLIPVDQSLVKRGMDQGVINSYNLKILKALNRDDVFKAPLETGEGTAVIRDGQQQVVERVLDGDKVIEVLVDGNGDKFTADIDLYSIGSKKPDNQTPYVHDNYGTTTDKEVEIIEEINKIFSSHDTHRNTDRDIVLHGSEVFNPSPEELDFPIRAFTPDGRVFDILQGPDSHPAKNLEEFKRWVLSQGYFIN